MEDGRNRTECVSAGRHAGNLSSVACHQSSGFTLAESMVVIVIVSLFVAMAMPYLEGLLARNSFRRAIQGFVSTLEAAAVTASQTGKKYEVIIDITEQGYIFREITSSDLSEVLEEEIIETGAFGNSCWVDYVMFADGDFANEGRAKFRAGRGGWQWGGIIVFVDQDGQFYSIVVNQLNNMVSVQYGEAEIEYPRAADELPF